MSNVRSIEQKSDRWTRMIAGMSPDDRMRLAAALRSATDISGRVPPHNADAEAAVLSAVLTDPRVLDTVQELLPSGEPFYQDANRRIFDAAIAVRAGGKPIDVQTVAAHLQDRDRLQAVGGIAYLAKILDATPSVANVAAHAKIVREKWRVRQLIETCTFTAAEGHLDYGEADTFIANAASSIAAIVEEDAGHRIESAEQVAHSRDEQIAAQWDGLREPWGMRGPHDRIHALTHGFGLGEQTYLASDTGGGKSVYALQVARHIAGRRYDGALCGVGYLSLEMMKHSHYDRALVQMTHELAREQGEFPTRGVKLDELMSGRVDGKGESLKQPQSQVARAKRWLIDESRRRWRELPILLDDAPKDINKVRSAARTMQRRLREEKGAKLRMLVIDHMHIMEFPDEDTEAQAIAKMVKDWNELAKELEIHMLVLAQYGRARNSRGGKPVISDIRGAAAIEQIAHKIALIYRQHVCRPDPEEASEEEKREAEFILGKHRNGKRGLQPMDFDGDAFTFTETNTDHAPDA